jgi:hypothetical protein
MAIFPGIVYAAPPQILNALRWEESRTKTRVVNHNRNGTRDLGPYQLNEKYLDDFQWRYNKGKIIDPFNYKQARFIANEHLDAMRRSVLTRDNDCGVAVKLSSWENILMAWNCGMSRMIRGAPEVSQCFARRVLARTGYGN